MGATLADPFMERAFKKLVREHASPRMARIFELFVDGYHFDEIAKLEDMQPASVRRAISRVRKMILQTPEARQLMSSF